MKKIIIDIIIKLQKHIINILQKQLAKYYNIIIILKTNSIIQKILLPYNSNKIYINNII